MKNRLYDLDIPIIAITGGIATGKSSVSDIIIENNHPLIDADKLIKEVYSKKETINFIANQYPSVIIDGTIDFKALRIIFFNDTNAKDSIENFLYPRLEKLFLQKSHGLDYLFYDVPLLYEKRIESCVDFITCVYCPRETQINRVIKRDSCSRELAEKILENQICIEKKKEMADYVISTEGPIDELPSKVTRMIEKCPI